MYQERRERSPLAPGSWSGIVYGTKCAARQTDTNPRFCAACGASRIPPHPPLSPPALHAPAEQGRALRLLLPLNRNVFAGHAGLFSILLLPGPIALLLGSFALDQLKKNPRPRGRGRAWFTVIAALATRILAFLAARSSIRH